MDNRRYSIKFSGVSNKQEHDGMMQIQYCYMFSTKDNETLLQRIPDLEKGKTSYNQVYPNNISEADGEKFLMLNYNTDDNLNLVSSRGISSLNSESGGNNFSIYRREYEVYELPGIKIRGYLVNNQFYLDSDYKNLAPLNSSYLYVDINSGLVYKYSVKNIQSPFQLVEQAFKIYKGEWEPVIVNNNLSSFRDYNIANDKTYQYILYPTSTTTVSGDNEVKQIFANYDGQVWEENSQYTGQGKFITGDYTIAYKNGAPITAHWTEWSIVELEPVETSIKAPIVKKTYKANIDQLWLFKYSLETGAQTQNISRSDFQTLGQFIKIGYGASNYISGEVSAYLGSEIIPYQQGYVERLRQSRIVPLSTNERTKMLERWRSFINSTNPKLLKDMKGQSWIVQIVSSTNTPHNFYKNQPDKISFSWKQVEDVKNVSIYGEIGTKEEFSSEGAVEWTPLFKTNKKF